ncbi:MAG: YeeE/YedE thiosulfate transporter family protein [Nitrosomonas sp.]|nr:YeeE/YedE thiosulfate transporter family protein [Nitrosomonas sp.]
MMHIIAGLSGLIFGLGLILSGMANPAIVLAFFDVAGNWNAALLWVMIGAITVGSIAFLVASKLGHSYLGLPMHLPASRKIDKRLLIGSFIFGIGWGMAGICPGPALVLVGTGHTEIFIFIASMLLGMGLFEAMRRKQ